MPRKKTAEDYYALADERGIHWISETVPLNTTTRTQWQCKEGHEWLAQYNNIRLGTGCPDCARNRRLDDKDYHALAHEKGYQWIGDNVPKNVYTVTSWQCSHGHRWSAKYTAIYAGGFCPHCVDSFNGVPASSQQRAIAKLVHGNLNISINDYCVDILTCWKGTKIIIEYDGWYWHQGQQSEDMRRILQLLNSGYRVLHIKGNKSLPDDDIIFLALDEMSQGGRWYIEIVLDDWGG